MIYFLLAAAVLAATRIGIVPPPVLVYPSINRFDGYDCRFLNTTDNPPLDVANFRRLLEIQSNIRILENPSINIEVRAALAQKWVDTQQVSTNAQLWQRWLNDDLEWQ
jgi:hypothetical protein